MNNCIPEVVNVKEEKPYYEDDNENFLDFNFDDKLKIEIDTYIEDWRIKDGNISQRVTNNLSTIKYDELLESCKQMCFLCSRTFPNSYHLLQHNLNHLKVPLLKRRLFICDHCPKYYTNIKDIEYHINNDHMLRIHGRPKKKRHSKFCKCVICNKRSKNSQWRLTDIDESHNYQCNRCDQQFKCKKYLNKHIKCAHEDYSKKIKCTLCPAILKDRYALTTHKRNCHSKKRIKCVLCDSVLKCQSYLFAHMRRVHYDDGVLHSCDICGKTFKSPRYLSIHKKNSHKRWKKV